MGAYAYCPRCETPLAKPTIFEIVYDTWTCSAGHHQEITEDHKLQALLDLEERQDELVKRVEALEAKST